MELKRVRLVPGLLDRDELAELGGAGGNGYSGTSGVGT